MISLPNLLQRLHHARFRPCRRVLLYVVFLDRLVESLIDDGNESLRFLVAFCSDKFAELFNGSVKSRACAEVDDALSIACAEGFFC